jgi:hypothetical protein
LIKIFIKFIFAFFLFGVLVVGAGISGFSFYVWPTGLADRPIHITPKMLQDLKALREERKFDPDKAHMYFGAPNEQVRASAQELVNVTIGSILLELPRSPSKSVVLAVFKRNLVLCQLTDSEERDQLLIYFQRIMEIVGIESSGELLNVWRYGFPYSWMT